jgi:hypothetical protein
MGAGVRKAAMIALLAGCSAAACSEDPVGVGEAVAIDLSASPGTLLYLDTVRLSVELRDGESNQLTPAGVTWSSSNPDVAVVSATGLVTGVWPGRATIRAASGALKDSVSLVIDTAPDGSHERCDNTAFLPLPDHGFFRLEILGGTVWNAESPLWTYFHGAMLFYGAGIMFGTSGTNMLVAHNPLRTFTDLIASGSCLVPEINGWHTVALLQAPGLDRNPAIAIPGLTVIQETFAFPNPTNNDYLLLRYSFVNEGAQAITGMRFGVLSDFDVGDTSDANVGSWNEAIGAAEVLSADSLTYPMMGGFKLVGVETESYRTTFPGPRTTRSAFYDYLANGSDGTDRTPVSDVMQLLGAAPFDIAPGESKSVWFAMAGGMTRAAFENNIARAAALADFLEPLSH